MAAILFGFRMVWSRNGPSHSYDFSYDGPFQNQTILNPNKTHWQISNGVWCSKFGFQAPTV